MDELKVITRSAILSDKDFVVNHWLPGQYWGSWYHSQMDEATYSGIYLQKIYQILQNPKTEILIAGVENDPNTCFGFIVFGGDILNWIYVRPEYRGKGIANLLMKGKGFKSCTGITRPGAAIAKKKKIEFNPYKLNMEI